MSISKSDFLAATTVAEFDALAEEAAIDLVATDDSGERYGPNGDGAIDAIDAWLNQTGLDQHRAELFRREMADGCDA